MIYNCYKTNQNKKTSVFVFMFWFVLVISSQCFASQNEIFFGKERALPDNRGGHFKINLKNILENGETPSDPNSLDGDENLPLPEEITSYITVILKPEVVNNLGAKWYGDDKNKARDSGKVIPVRTGKKIHISANYVHGYITPEPQTVLVPFPGDNTLVELKYEEARDDAYTDPNGHLNLAVKGLVSGLFPESYMKKVLGLTSNYNDIEDDFKEVPLFYQDQYGRVHSITSPVKDIILIPAYFSLVHYSVPMNRIVMLLENGEVLVWGLITNDLNTGNKSFSDTKTYYYYPRKLLPREGNHILDEWPSPVKKIRYDSNAGWFLFQLENNDVYMTTENMSFMVPNTTDWLTKPNTTPYTYYSSFSTGSGYLSGVPFRFPFLPETWEDDPVDIDNILSLIAYECTVDNNCNFKFTYKTCIHMLAKSGKLFTTGYSFNNQFPVDPASLPEPFKYQGAVDKKPLCISEKSYMSTGDVNSLTNGFSVSDFVQGHIEPVNMSDQILNGTKYSLLKYGTNRLATNSGSYYMTKYPSSVSGCVPKRMSEGFAFAVVKGSNDYEVFGPYRNTIVNVKPFGCTNNPNPNVENITKDIYPLTSLPAPIKDICTVDYGGIHYSGYADDRIMSPGYMPVLLFLLENGDVYSSHGTAYSSSSGTSYVSYSPAPTIFYLRSMNLKAGKTDKEILNSTEYRKLLGLPKVLDIKVFYGYNKAETVLFHTIDGSYVLGGVGSFYPIDTKDIFGNDINPEAQFVANPVRLLLKDEKPSELYKIIPPVSEITLPTIAGINVKPGLALIKKLYSTFIPLTVNLNFGQWKIDNKNWSGPGSTVQVLSDERHLLFFERDDREDNFFVFTDSTGKRYIPPIDRFIDCSEHNNKIIINEEYTPFKNSNIYIWGTCDSSNILIHETLGTVSLSSFNNERTKEEMEPFQIWKSRHPQQPLIITGFTEEASYKTQGLTIPVVKTGSQLHIKGAVDGQKPEEIIIDISDISGHDSSLFLQERVFVLDSDRIRNQYGTTVINTHGGIPDIYILPKATDNSQLLKLNRQTKHFELCNWTTLEKNGSYYTPNIIDQKVAPSKILKIVPFENLSLLLIILENKDVYGSGPLPSYACPFFSVGLGLRICDLYVYRSNIASIENQLKNGSIPLPKKLVSFNLGENNRQGYMLGENNLLYSLGKNRIDLVTRYYDYQSNRYVDFDLDFSITDICGTTIPNAPVTGITHQGMCALTNTGKLLVAGENQWNKPYIMSSVYNINTGTYVDLPDDMVFVKIKGCSNYILAQTSTGEIYHLFPEERRITPLDLISNLKNIPIPDGDISKIDSFMLWQKNPGGTSTFFTEGFVGSF